MATVVGTTPVVSPTRLGSSSRPPSEVASSTRRCAPSSFADTASRYPYERCRHRSDTNTHRSLVPANASSGCPPDRGSRTGHRSSPSSRSDVGGSPVSVSDSCAAAVPPGRGCRLRTDPASRSRRSGRSVVHGVFDTGLRNPIDDVGNIGHDRVLGDSGVVRSSEGPHGPDAYANQSAARYRSALRMHTGPRAIDVPTSFHSPRIRPSEGSSLLGERARMLGESAP